MISTRRLALAASLFLLIAASVADARPPQLLPDAAASKVRRAAKSREKLSLPDLPLGRASLDTIDLEPMELWATGAKIVVHGPAGMQTLDPPDVRYFRGRVRGEEQSSVFLSVSDAKMDGLVLVGEKRFALGSAKRVKKSDGDADDDVLAIREIETADEPSPGDWKCDVESEPILALRNLTTGLTPKTTAVPSDVTSNDGSVANAAYQLRLAIETDFELYQAFNDVGAATAYVTSLVGNASIVFQRDLNTTLTLGHLELNITQDVWDTVPIQGTAAALAEVSKEWHDDARRAGVLRSAVVMISGKAFHAGRAFQGTMCGMDTSCGSNGESCGDPVYANSYAGAYAFCGTNGQAATTVPDPTVTRNGVTYAMPNTNDYWMLYLFTHEVGHLANGPHTNCVQLTFEERVQYNVQRAYVDECNWTEANCFSGQPTIPAEFGTIMGSCHEMFDGNGNRAARYLFWEPNRPSAKMLPILRSGIDAVTPDGAIRLGSYPNPNQEDSQPVSCEAGRTAHVTHCATCTYTWSITGGTINSATNTSSITYTPSAPSVTLTITVTQPTGCGITTSRTFTSACASVPAPSSFHATANGGSSVSVTWSAVSGAASYEVSRTSNGSTWTVIGAPAATTFVDLTPTAGTVYLYRVRGIDSGSYPGSYSSSDFAAAFDFTDPTLFAQATLVRAAHITELRTAVNALRSLVGLGGAAFTDPDPTGTPARRLHIEELRARLAEAIAAAGRPGVTYTDPTLTVGSLMRTAHIAELRTALR